MALLLGGALVGMLVGEALSGADAAGGHRASVFWALAVVGLAFPLIYVMVARGLVAEPDRFFVWWGVSVLAKLGWFAIAGVLLVVTGLAVKKVFLLTLAAAFPVFTAHQVLRLVWLADASRDRAS